MPLDYELVSKRLKRSNKKESIASSKASPESSSLSTSQVYYPGADLLHIWQDPSAFCQKRIPTFPVESRNSDFLQWQMGSFLETEHGMKYDKSRLFLCRCLIRRALSFCSVSSKSFC